MPEWGESRLFIGGPLHFSWNIPYPEERGGSVFWDHRYHESRFPCFFPDGVCRPVSLYIDDRFPRAAVEKMCWQIQEAMLRGPGVRV